MSITKNILKNIPGIAQSEVTLDPAQATIQYDPAHTSLNQLKEAIIDAGFEVMD